MFRKFIPVKGLAEQQPYELYSATIDALHDDAREDGQENVLAYVLTQTLASIIVQCPSHSVSGVILGSLSDRIRELTDREQSGQI